MKFEIGKTYVFFIPPSWLVTGKIHSQDEDSVEVHQGVYLENAGADSSPMALGLAENVTAAVTKWHRIPDGAQYRKDAVLMLMPCDVDLSPLYASGEADAIRGKRASKK